MRNISAANLAALQARALVARDFLWIVARNRVTGGPVADGMWSDVGNVSASVIHPDTGLEVTRDWFGSGTLVAIDDIPLVSNLTVQNVNIRLSQVDDRVEQLVRDYDCKQARVEIYRGLFDPDSRQMVAPAECRFVGFVDTIEIKTPDENEEGGVTLTCASHTQEMTRANPDTRSHETQKLRSASDTFFKDSATVEAWEVFWGSVKGAVPTQKKRKKFLGIF
ncbi:hypothetical protein [Aminobacter sp. AP02]|uniref:hypothetical protein n=1 Tax=Aminobacter sp. AP02 TaxID=2135737 RepID=UPI000D6D7A9B|nr:hypothetical protein [Aminobacter sp. AP02]PWK65879.1 hypothetical protein C8K44_11594 [Aminobacter sp. AP02]